MKKIFVSIIFLTILFSGMPVAFAQDASQGSKDVLEVQIPKPKFYIFKSWQYGGFWRWDEKDPRFFKEFLQKIHESLSIGPF